MVKVDGQTQVILFSLTMFLLAVWILKERVKLRDMASSHDISKWAVLSGVVAFIAVLNSIVFVPIIPSGLMSAIILGNRRWVSFASLLTLVIGLYLVLSCFYCFGGLSR